jgi:flagellar hook-basal body complex protein FliE
MTLPTTAIPAVIPAISPAKITPAAPASGTGLFRAMLEQSISSVELQRTAAQQSVDRFLSGEGEELHQVAMATQKAELSLDLFLQMRNKVVSAYQEIMRMQI